MSAPCPLYQTLTQRIEALLRDRVPRRSRTRFALLVGGILAAQSAVLARIAAELAVLALTGATVPASIERRLRRTLADPHLTYATCYVPLLGQILDWDTVRRGSRRVVLAVDDSSHTDRVHLLRVSLTYWGGSLPLAWALWPQNQAQPDGFYWEQIDRLMAQVAALLPADVEVIVVADRAFAVPNFVDRVAKHDWHWVVRVTTTGSHRFRDARGHEVGLRDVVTRQVGQRGRRWKARGAVFKDAGWRAASVVGLWGQGAAESVVVLSDLPARWELLALYERRYWIEPGFRNDKTRGWQWESSQVRGVAHHAGLVLGLAWASAVVVSVGLGAAREQEAWEQQRRALGVGGQVRRARESVFTLGLRGVRRWLYGTSTAALPWEIGELDGPSWLQRWHRCQARGLIFPPLRPPRPGGAPPGTPLVEVVGLVLLILAHQQPNRCSVRS
jgi:Transposase DDE domain